MVHNRKLVIGAVSLTQARLRGVKDMQALTEIRDELEKEIVESRYLNDAPFRWVGLIIRYGVNNDNKPEYSRINKKHGDLPLAIEIDTRRMIDASYEELLRIFRRASLISLIDAGKKYNLPTDRLEKLLFIAKESY